MTLQYQNLTHISRYINWTYFFRAWRLSGRYEGIEKVCTCTACESAWLQSIDAAEREKAQEALKLLRDAQQMLADIVNNNLLWANLAFVLVKAKSGNEGIALFPENHPEGLCLPMLRQQFAKEKDYYLSLADFISPEEDKIGVFAVSIAGGDELQKRYDDEEDTYRSLLVQTIADRLTEAAAEWLHEQVRKNYWGYAPDENLSLEDLFKAKYQGIRPAIGYPSLPDQSLIFDLDKILDFKQIGISITENGAMSPTSSACGLMISHPKSQYFMIGKIGDDQLADYARRKGMTIEQVRKWISL